MQQITNDLKWCVQVQWVQWGDLGRWCVEHPDSLRQEAVQRPVGVSSGSTVSVGLASLAQWCYWTRKGCQRSVLPGTWCSPPFPLHNCWCRGVHALVVIYGSPRSFPWSFPHWAAGCCLCTSSQTGWPSLCNRIPIRGHHVQDIYLFISVLEVKKLDCSSHFKFYDIINYILFICWTWMEWFWYVKVTH